MVVNSKGNPYYSLYRGFILAHTTSVVVLGCFGVFRGRRLITMIYTGAHDSDLTAHGAEVVPARDHVEVDRQRQRLQLA